LFPKQRPGDTRSVLGDPHDNDPELRQQCHRRGWELVAPRRGPSPHLNGGVASQHSASARAAPRNKMPWSCPVRADPARATLSRCRQRRTPAFRRRLVSGTMRQRLMLLLMCSMRTRRHTMRRFAAFCARVRARPRGFLAGMITWACGSVNARKPKSWSNRLPGGHG
jgi:hypothetical protein